MTLGKLRRIGEQASAGIDARRWHMRCAGVSGLVTLCAVACLSVLASGEVAGAQGRMETGKSLPEHSARRLLSRAEQAQIKAVGQLSNTAGGRHCTGTLIAPDLVLTAAHCVASREKGWIAPPYRILFSAEFRDGYAPVKRNGAALVVGEGYMQGGDIGADLALVRLKDPIPMPEVAPLPVADHSLLRGHLLSVFSYGYDASNALALEESCRSLAAMGAAMVTSCEAVGGVSGAPVVAQDPRTGRARVTAVVSSRLDRSGGVPGYGRAVVVPVDQARLARMISKLSAPDGG